MGKRKKKIVISREEEIKIRKPTAPPGFVFKDKKKYNRKAKYKKGWESGKNYPSLFSFLEGACKIPLFATLR